MIRYATLNPENATAFYNGVLATLDLQGNKLAVVHFEPVSDAQ